MPSLRGVFSSARKLPFVQLLQKIRKPWVLRSASTHPAASCVVADLEPESTILKAEELGQNYGKKLAWKLRRYQHSSRRKDFKLPGSRWSYHPPKYNRGRLHPVQSLPSSNPLSRTFVPGPFNMPRLKETYLNTITPDLMILTYNHVPPGTKKKEQVERLRRWDPEISPYHANRGLRGPRGHSGGLPLIEKDITFRNIPCLKKITIDAFVPKAIHIRDRLIGARQMLVALTGQMPEITFSKNNVKAWQLVRFKRAGVKTTIYGDKAYELLDKIIHLVLPNIKEWRGLPVEAGDGSGQISFGFSSEDMRLFPEIGVNYNMYPPKYVPGCHIHVKTTATSDRQTKLLFQSLGMPFTTDPLPKKKDRAAL